MKSCTHEAIARKQVNQGTRMRSQARRRKREEATESGPAGCASPLLRFPSSPPPIRSLSLVVWLLVHGFEVVDCCWLQMLSEVEARRQRRRRARRELRGSERGSRRRGCDRFRRVCGHTTTVARKHKAGELTLARETNLNNPREERGSSGGAAAGQRSRPRSPFCRSSLCAAALASLFVSA